MHETDSILVSRISSNLLSSFSSLSLLSSADALLGHLMMMDALVTNSLADRVKSSKRQRSDSSSHSKPKQESKKNNKDHKSNNKDNNHKSSGSCNSSPVKKQSKMSSPVKSSSSSYINSHISSSYLSSSAPQLKCLSSSLPAAEKFEAMVDELFELSSSGTNKRKKPSSSDDEDFDSEDKKKKKPKTNGEVPGLFDITLSGETLNHFVGVTAKLKRSNQMGSQSTSKISTLLSALTQQLTVQSAGLKRRKSTDEQNANASDEDEEDNNITTSTQLMHKFESCCDCSCIALNILSSKGKKVLCLSCVFHQF